MRLLWFTFLCLLSGCGAPGAPSQAPVETGRARVDNVAVSLEPGWNAVGLRGAQVTELAGGAGVAGFATWGGGSYTTDSFTQDALNAGAAGRRGLWVYARESTSFTYSGGEAATTIDLTAGWNLISLAAPADVPGSRLTVAQNGTPVPLSSVLLPAFLEIGPHSAYTSVDAVTGTLRSGRPYWVFAANAVQLRVAAPSPSPLPSPSAAVSPGPGPSPLATASPSPTGGSGGGYGGFAGINFDTPPPATVGAGESFALNCSAVALSSLDAWPGGPLTLSAPGLAGVTTRPARNGEVVNFAGMSFSTVGLYQIFLSAGGFPLGGVFSPTILVTPGQPAGLRCTQPVTGLTGTDLYPVVGVELLDRHGNRITSDSTTEVSLAVTGPTNLALHKTVMEGFVAFPSLALGTPGNYTLMASAAGNPPTTTGPFNVVDPVAGRTMTVRPGLAPSVTAGEVLRPEVECRTNGALDATASDPVVAYAVPGSDSPLRSAVLAQTVTPSGGVARFALPVTVAGNYTLHFRTTGSAEAQATVNVSPAQVAMLRFVQQPSDVAVNEDFVPPVSVEAVDVFGNRVTTAQGEATMTEPSLILTGARQTLVQGTATFSRLRLRQALAPARLRVMGVGEGWTDSLPFRCVARPVPSP